MIKAVNSGDKNALRKLLKLYSQAIFQRAQSNTGDSTSAKEVTRVVLADIASCASNGTCREDIDAWLMSLTDSRSQEYIAQMQLREAENNRRMAQKQSYFTAPTVSGTVPSSTAYATNHSSIYEREDPFAEEVTAEDEFIPFSPTLTIPECPEFSDRQDECSTQSRTSSITPPSAPYVEPLHAAPFVPPQYVPPQYTPPHASPVIDEINASRQVYENYEESPSFTAQPATQSYTAYEQTYTQNPSNAPLFSDNAANDNVVPISLNEEEAELELKGRTKKKNKKSGSFLNNSVLIAVIVIILMLVIGVLLIEVVGMLLN